ncbi:hypothetical protein V8C37DRAFT_360011 [Trichoderma ceciliae]
MRKSARERAFIFLSQIKDKSFRRAAAIYRKCSDFPQLLLPHQHLYQHRQHLRAGSDVCSPIVGALSEIQQPIWSRTKRRGPKSVPLSRAKYHTKGFTRKYDKNRHMFSHCRGTIVCLFCPGVGSESAVAFDRIDGLNRHLFAAHHVDQSMRYATNKDDHLGTVCTNSRASVVCSNCNSSFAAPQEFFEHLNDSVLSTIVPARAPMIHEMGFDSVLPPADQQAGCLELNGLFTMLTFLQRSLKRF